MSRPVVVHEYLRRARETSIDGLAWLDRLPSLIEEACRGWDIEIAGEPYEGGVCGWVAPVRGASGEAVLKVSWPHAEAATEAVALRWWDGAGTVRLLAEGSDAWTMLLERCEPGTPLRDVGLPNERGLAIGAELLNALWSKGAPPGDGPRFDSMAQVCDEWAQGAERRAERYRASLRALGTDPGILTLGIELLRGLPRSSDRQVVVHGDFNPGNLLAASRAPYLAIDPKPMLGDPAYDPWSLVAQLGDRQVARTYRALVLGEVEGESGVVDAPIGRSVSTPTRMAVSRRGKEARTRYRVEQRYTEPAPTTLLTAMLETGRTHQIRVHLSAIGHPVVGDDVYARGRSLPGATVGRPFLHAYRLGLTHPATGARDTWDSPLPADLEEQLGALHA